MKKARQKIISIIEALRVKLGYGWPVLFTFVYFAWFILLERYEADEYFILYCPIDDMIPFCEYFIIFYASWFIYIPVVFFFFFKKSKEEFYRLSSYMFAGMFISLFVCTVFPNAQELRPEPENDNIFTRLVIFLYGIDTNTNCFPSVHVFNSIAAHVCIVKSSYIKKGHPVKWMSFVLIVLICLSTLFLKQHSVIDLAGGALLAAILYVIIFKIVYRNMEDKPQAD